MSRIGKTKKEQAIEALLIQPSVQKAAESVGVTARTLFRWLQNNAFINELEAARKQTFNRSLHRLAGLVQKALNRIEAILDDDNATDKDHLRAAALVLSHAEAGELSEIVKQLETQLSTMENSL